jgi:hypothetical protein
MANLSAVNRREAPGEEVEGATVNTDVTLSDLPAATLAAPPAASTHRGAPAGYVASAKTLRERLAYLEMDARRILREPGSHGPEVVRWARDMVSSTAARPASKVEV